MSELKLFENWWQILLFCFGVYVIVQVLRLIVEGLRPSIKVNYYWNEVVMPTLPALMGCLMCIKYPFPTAITNWEARLVLGICGGWASGWAYRVVKAVIKSYTGVDLDKNSQPNP